MTNRNLRVWRRLAVVAAVMALLLFVPAGTIRYWQAWVYLALFVGFSIFTTLYLMRHDPALLARRMKGGARAETRPAQKVIMKWMSLGFCGLLVVPALDFRFGWSAVPAAVIVAGDALVAMGFSFIFVVARANTFMASTVVVAENQRVISSGPYAIVRHPMYASALLYLVGTPLALRSYWGLLVFGLMIPIMAWRLLDEESLLAGSLAGYPEYQQKVRSRLLPFIW